MRIPVILFAVATLAAALVVGSILTGADAAPKCNPGSTNPQCVSPTPTPISSPTPSPSPRFVIDRALVVPAEASPWMTHLIDTDDGSLVAAYPNGLPFATSCDGMRALVHIGYQEVVLIDGVTGAIIATFVGPTGTQAYLGSFSCQHAAALDSGLDVVTARAVIVHSSDSVNTSVRLIDTTNGNVIQTYTGYGIGADFNCRGDRVRIPGVGMVDALSGAKIHDAPGPPDHTRFLCGSW